MLLKTLKALKKNKKEKHEDSASGSLFCGWKEIVLSISYVLNQICMSLLKIK